MKEIVVVGCGFFGSTVAERIASCLHIPVRIIEKRDHIGGNSWSAPCEITGIDVHQYGSHIFHTSDQVVWDYISQFTQFNQYHHRVYTTHRNHVYNMPINLHTINAYFKKNLQPFEVHDFLQAQIADENICSSSNLEEKAISLIGRSLYEAFFKGYTEKQWQTSPRNLPASIVTRLPIRHNFNNRYFSDKYEGIPIHGYGELFRKLLDHPLITVDLNCDFLDFKDEDEFNDTLVVYTGPIDAYFRYCHGKLAWRTVSFVKEIHHYHDYQGTAVMNYADANVPYTRIHEYKHYHPERPFTKQTVIAKEYSRFSEKDDDPSYPIENEVNRKIYQAYVQESRSVNHVIFGGRLGTYAYMDMDKTIRSALDCFESVIRPRILRTSSTN